MKTYDEEYAELVAWSKAQAIKTDEIPCEQGLDGKHTTETWKDQEEWNRRLIALKIKYGKPLSEQAERIRLRLKTNI